jgi:hypothetical protein
MDKCGLAGKIKEQEREIEFLRGEVGRLRAAIAQRAGSLEGMLKRRGFRVFRKEQGEGDVIRPSIGGKKLSDEFYTRLNKYSFRLFLRDVIKFQEGFEPGDLVRYSTLEVVNEYTAFLHRAGILKKLSGGRYALKAKVKSFGPTLEWFICELIRREYAAEAVWGASFKRTSAGGDYDLLAAIEGRLLYAEVKSSPPKQIYDTEVKAYIERLLELSPDMSLFIMDTELRMKDKIVVLFEQVLPHTPLRGLAVTRLKAELFHVGERIVIINSKDSLASNIGEAIGWFLKRS